MYELWGRKRKVENKGFPYELIMKFDNENYKFIAIDSLDKEVYQEAMITYENECIMFIEFEKSKIKKIGVKND